MEEFMMNPDDHYLLGIYLILTLKPGFVRSTSLGRALSNWADAAAGPTIGAASLHMATIDSRGAASMVRRVLGSLCLLERILRVC
jgi:hypothetical protein